MILAVVEYDKSSGEAVVDVRYNGKPFDPASGGNALSYKLLQGLVSELTYKPVVEDVYQNHVHIVLG